MSYKEFFLHKSYRKKKKLRVTTTDKSHAKTQHFCLSKATVDGQ